MDTDMRLHQIEAYLKGGAVPGVTKKERDAFHRSASKFQLSPEGMPVIYTFNFILITTPLSLQVFPMLLELIFFISFI